MEVNASERRRAGPSRKPTGVPRADDKADRSPLGIERRGEIRNLRRRRLPGLWGVRDVHGHGGHDAGCTVARSSTAAVERVRARSESARPGSARSRQVVDREAGGERFGRQHLCAACLHTNRGRGAQQAPARAALATGKVALPAIIWTANTQVVRPQRDRPRFRGHFYSGGPIRLSLPPADRRTECAAALASPERRSGWGWDRRGGAIAIRMASVKLGKQRGKVRAYSAAQCSAIARAVRLGMRRARTKRRLIRAATVSAIGAGA